MFQSSTNSEGGDPQAATMAQSAPGSYTPPPNLFLLHDMNRSFLDGTSRHLTGTTRFLILAIAVLIVAVVLFISPLPGVLSANAIEHSGTVVQGVVTRRFNSGSYYVVFQFPLKKDAGTPEYVSQQQQVSQSTFNRLAQSTPVTISYDPANPRRARLAGSDADDSDVTGNIPSVVILGVLLLVAAAWSLRMYLRKRRLSREGRLIGGTLTTLRMSRGRRGYQVFVKYKFNSPNGLALEGKDAARRANPDQAQIPVGTPVAVVYADDKCYSIL